MKKNYVGMMKKGAVVMVGMVIMANMTGCNVVTDKAEMYNAKVQINAEKDIFGYVSQSDLVKGLK